MADFFECHLPTSAIQMQSINILDPIYNNPATRSAEGKEIGIFFLRKGGQKPLVESSDASSRRKRLAQFCSKQKRRTYRESKHKEFIPKTEPLIRKEKKTHVAKGFR